MDECIKLELVVLRLFPGRKTKEVLYEKRQGSPCNATKIFKQGCRLTVRLFLTLAAITTCLAQHMRERVYTIKGSRGYRLREPAQRRTNRKGIPQIHARARLFFARLFKETTDQYQQYWSLNRSVGGESEGNYTCA